MTDEYFNPGIRMTSCIAKALNDWNNENLSAPYWRLYWNRNEGGQVRWNGVVTPLDSKHLVLIAPNTPFASHNGRVIEHLYLHFITPSPYAGLAPTLLRIPIDKGTQQRAGELYPLSADGALLSNRAIMLAFSLIHLALAHISDALLKRAENDARILAAMRYMEESPQAPPSNAALARAARMNTNAFIRLFKQQAGVSPQSYGMDKRIEQACLLLHHSSIGIKDIAERTGFCDRYHFTRVFTRIRGVPPAEFRRQTYAALTDHPGDRR